MIKKYCIRAIKLFSLKAYYNFGFTIRKEKRNTLTISEKFVSPEHIHDSTLITDFTATVVAGNNSLTRRRLIDDAEAHTKKYSNKTSAIVAVTQK